MMLVDRIPIKSPTKGLFVADIIFSTKSSPIYFSATPRRIILKKNKYNRINNRRIFNIIERIDFDSGLL